MSINLDEWDLKVKPHLKEIELSCGWLRWYAKKILEACRSLSSRPGFETLAEDEIAKSIEYLEEALAGLRKAQEIYQSKGVQT